MKFCTAALTLLIASTTAAAQQIQHDSLHPDDRYKADLLLVVAHPDDESAIGAYLARAAFDEHRRIAVVFGTRGNTGGNEWGPEQAGALGAIREIEGRRALGFLGIYNVWFLDAPDTPGQDVLRSLETWDHGRALGRLVRIMRLTRPQVVATWLPAYSAGENHGDHQAAGVIATEAFDIAGDPSQYAEQVAPSRDPREISNLTEGLRPWQPQKLYYFSDAAHVDFLEGQGPRYSATAVSPAKNVSYAHLSAEECAFHLTQSDSGYAAHLALEKNDLKNTYFTEDSRFIYGKSQVPATKTGDLFEGVRHDSLAYVPAPGYKNVRKQNASLSLGGPWHFYAQFCPAHGIEQMTKLVPPEVLAGVNTTVAIPYLLTNTGTSASEAEVHVAVPPGWKVQYAGHPVNLQPGDTYAGRVLLTAASHTSKEWQNITLNAGPFGTETVRVQVSQFSLPQ